MRINTLSDFTALSTKQLRQLPVKEQIKGLRYFRSDLDKIDLRRDVHINTARKIERLIDDFIDFKSQPNARLVTPTAKRRSDIRRLAKVSDKRWTKFFVSFDDPANQQIRYNKDGAYLSSPTVSRRDVFWDVDKVILDSDAEIDRILQGQDFDVAHIGAGLHLWGGDFSPTFYSDIDALKQIIAEKMREYKSTVVSVNGRETPKIDTLSDWMWGLRLVSFKNQDSDVALLDYRNAIKSGERGLIKNRKPRKPRKKKRKRKSKN